MGFVMRLNSRDLVNDPKNGAEVYPITATNAVYRAGTDKNLEQILSELSNGIDRKVIQDLEYLSNTNNLQISYTDNTTEDITLPNWIKNVTVTNSGRTYTITVTPTYGNASTYQITLPEINYPVTDVQIRGTSVVSNNIANMDVVKNNNDIHAVQYVASEAAYESMTKDPNTLYFIPVESN